MDHLHNIIGHWCTRVGFLFESSRCSQFEWLQHIRAFAIFCFVFSLFTLCISFASTVVAVPHSTELTKLFFSSFLQIKNPTANNVIATIIMINRRAQTNRIQFLFVVWTDWVLLLKNTLTFGRTREPLPLGERRVNHQLLGPHYAANTHWPVSQNAKFELVLNG